MFVCFVFGERPVDERDRRGIEELCLIVRRGIRMATAVLSEFVSEAVKISARAECKVTDLDLVLSLLFTLCCGREIAGLKTDGNFADPSTLMPLNVTSRPRESLNLVPSISRGIGAIVGSQRAVEPDNKERIIFVCRDSMLTW